MQPTTIDLEVRDRTISAPRDPGIAGSGITLRAGIGVSFAPSMRSRALFLDRLARGAASEGRTATRYPTELAGEVTVRSTERAIDAKVLDVAVRGARLALSHDAHLEPGSALSVRIAMPRSGEFTRSPLVGRIAWIDRPGVRFRGSAEGVTRVCELGVRLELSTADERLTWAKIVTRAREALEEHPLRADRDVG